MTAILYKISVWAWVSGTAEKMETAGVEDRKAWARYWGETYKALGGTSSSTATKGCPRCAAYALWHLGWLKGSKRPALSWSVNEIRHNLGKNAAYATTAVHLLRQGAKLYPVGQLWKSVRREFKRATGENAANSEQGAVKLAVGLFLEGKLVAA